MYTLKLISISFLIILLNISCKSSSYLSSDQENEKYSHYLYGLGKNSDSDSPDPNTICQYRCILNPPHDINKSCDRYYFFNIDKLDKTTLELVQNPMAFNDHYKKGPFKTFKLKNLHDLFNHKDVIKDNDDDPRCDFTPYFMNSDNSTNTYFDRRDSYQSFFLWTPDFKNNLLFYPNQPLSLIITEEGKNDIWSKCTIIHHRHYVYALQKEEGYCKTNEKGNYHILVITNDKDPVYLDYDYMNEDTKKDFLNKYILPNLEYLGLQKKDCVTFRGDNKCISLSSGFIFDIDTIQSKPSYSLKRLALLATFSKDDDLYFHSTLTDLISLIYTKDKREEVKVISVKRKD